MTRPFLRFGFGTVVVVCLTLPSWAQVSTPRMPDGHPDLSGLWNGAVTGINRVSEEDGNLTSNVASRRWNATSNRCDATSHRVIRTYGSAITLKRGFYWNANPPPPGLPGVPGEGDLLPTLTDQTAHRTQSPTV